MDGIPSGKVKNRREPIKASLGNGLDDVSRMLIKDTLELLDHLDEKVSDTSLEILGKLQEKARDLAIVMSVTGIGFVSASIILAEIGAYHDFQKSEQPAKKVWIGSRTKRICGEEERLRYH